MHREPRRAVSIRGRAGIHLCPSCCASGRRQEFVLRRHMLAERRGTPNSMNMIEKILAKASGKKEVRPGEVVVSNVNLMVMHDLSANFVTRVFREELGGGSVLDPSRIAFVFDHNFSPATEQAAERLFKIREFAAQYGIKNVFQGGNGSLHHVIIENGLWAPGHVIIGCDSHTPIYGALGAFATGVGNNSMAALGFQHGSAWFKIPETIQVFLRGSTRDGVTARDIAQYVVGHLGEDSCIYKAIEYAGPYIRSLSIEDRILFPLMSIDLGAKASFIDPDDKTVDLPRSAAAPEDDSTIFACLPDTFEGGASTPASNSRLCRRVAPYIKLRCKKDSSRF